MNKQTIKEFIVKLLEEAECRGIHEIGSNNLNSQCPYHRPKNNTTAFGISYVDEDKGYPFQCFSCKKTGTILHLIMHVKECNYKHAENLLFKKILLPVIDTKSLKRKLRRIDMEMEHKEDYEPNIELPERSKADKLYDYFNERNGDMHHDLLRVIKIIHKYKLYYCGQGYYSRRIIMPVRNLNGKVIYFTNRAIDDGAKKTLHPAGIKQEKYIYGLYEAKGNSRVIVVEGPFDAFQIYSGIIRMKIEDIGVVAILGTNMTEERANIIGTVFDEAYLLFDEDEAGTQADRQATNILSDYLRVHSLSGILNRGKDPGTANQRHLKCIFRAIGTNSRNTAKVGTL